MQTIKEAASEFLAKKRVAVTGVSRTPKTHGANTVYKRLRDRGYEVFAVNPNAVEVEGDLAYSDLSSIPGGVDAVVIATASSTCGCTTAPVRAAFRRRRPTTAACTGSRSSTAGVR
jgi:uncharacterized protein